MLNERQLEALPERISLRLRQVNELALQKIGTRIKEIGKMKPSDVHKAKQLMTYGSGYDEIVSMLAEVSKKNEQDIYDIFDVIANDNSLQAKELAKVKQISFKSYKDNEQLKQFVNAMAKQTVDTYRNMTNTIAFMRRDENGKRLLTSLSKTYQDITDKAVTAVATGVEDYQSAMRQVIKDLADSGLRTKYQPLKGSAGKTVDYASGYSRRLDTAVRQNILWGVKECNQNISDMLGEELGADGYEISYHSNPRPSHEEMGGRQYAIGNGRKINGKYYPPFSSVEGLLSDYGCLHFKFPIILGVSVSAYSDQELKAMKEQSKQKVMFEGKEYTMYECKQMQRQLETAARHAKDRQIIAKASGDDVLRRLEQERINAITHKYKQLSDTSGLPTKMERMSVSKYHRVKTNNEISVPKELKSSKKSAIIKNTNVERTVVTDVHSIGKIDIEKFKCISKDILTDEVIITDERIQHIKDRHNDDFEKIKPYFREILKSPDYILEDSNRKNTGLILKQITKDDLRVQMVLRVHTSTDKKGYKNSIISAWEISESRWQNYLKNKKILYKSE